MHFLYFVLAGICGGVLAGMGMGGGTLTLPILVVGMGVGQFTAQFANLAAFLPSGTTALCVHVKNGLVKAKPLKYLLLPAILACVATSFLASKIEGDLLKRLFGGFLAALSIASFSIKIFGKKKLN